MGVVVNVEPKVGLWSRYCGIVVSGLWAWLGQGAGLWSEVGKVGLNLFP